MSVIQFVWSLSPFMPPSINSSSYPPIKKTIPSMNTAFPNTLPDNPIP